MNLDEAIRDTKRPLSITPKEWMMSVEASLAEEDDITKGTAKRLRASKDDSVDDTDKKKDLKVSGLENIDMGIDQVIQGIKLIYSGLSDTDKANLTPNIRQSVDSIKEIMDTAIVPYMKDITEYSDKFESEEE